MLGMGGSVAAAEPGSRAARARAARLWQDGAATGDGDAPMDPLKINDEIAELKRELMQLQIQQQEAQRANDFDLNNRLAASITHGIERLDELQAQLGKDITCPARPPRCSASPTSATSSAALSGCAYG